MSALTVSHAVPTVPAYLPVCPSAFVSFSLLRSAAARSIWPELTGKDTSVEALERVVQQVHAEVLEQRLL